MISYLKKIGHNEDNLIAMGIAWTIGIVFFTLAGLYMSLIINSDHQIDFQDHDFRGALPGMGLGFLIGLSVALFVTIMYPKWTAADEAAESAQH